MICNILYLVYALMFVNSDSFPLVNFPNLICLGLEMTIILSSSSCLTNKVKLCLMHVYMPLCVCVSVVRTDVELGKPIICNR